MKPNVVAIIPARGGSKGIPKKNILPLAGKPLIAHTIEASISSGVVDRTIVSTDCQEIANTSKEYGAEIIERPNEFATDTASSESVLFHAIETLEKQGYSPDIIVFLQCTSPLRKAEVITEAVNKVINKGYDSALSAYKSFKYYGKHENEEYIPFRKERIRRQEMTPWYCDNGAVYVVKKDILLKERNRYGGKIGLVMMSEEDSIEIDTLLEKEIMEKLFEKRKTSS